MLRHVQYFLKVEDILLIRYQIIFGDLVGLKEEKPRKTSPRKLVPTGDRTRARCMTGAHAIACTTAMNNYNHNFNKYTVSSLLGETTLPEISLGICESFIHKRDELALFTSHGKVCMVSLRSFHYNNILEKCFFHGYTLLIWYQSDL